MLLSSISLALTRLGQRLGRWSPLALWPDGIDSPGMWISPRDLTSQWQDSAGTTPVVTPGTVADSSNPVGLAYDLRAGTVTASPSTADLSGATWTRYAATPLGNQITFTGQYGNIGNTGFFPANTAAVSIGRIVLTLDIEHVSGNTNLATAFRDLAAPGANVIYPLILTSGQRTTLTQIHVFIGDVPPYGPEIIIVQDRNTSNFAVVKLHSVTYAYTPGNHMLQSTSAARPLLSGRVNQIVSTDDLTGTGWVGGGGANTPTTLVDTRWHVSSIVGRAYQVVTMQFEAMAVSTATGIIARIDRDGIAQGNEQTFAINSASWTLITKTATLDNGTNPPVFRIDVDGTGAVYIRHCQIESGAVATAYQQVNTASDYDATGITPFQLYDGVDDSMATASFAAGTLINGMDCMIAVRRDSGAATYLISDTGSRGFFEWESGDTNRPDVSAGTPTYYVDGVACTATRGALFTALTVGDWHILEARGLDLSTWTALEVSGLVSYRLNGPRGDIMLYPSTASTTDKDAARQWLADHYGVTLP